MTRAVSQAEISRAVKALTDAGHLPEVVLEPGRATIRPMGKIARPKPTIDDAKPKEWGDE